MLGKEKGATGVSCGGIGILSGLRAAKWLCPSFHGAMRLPCELGGNTSRSPMVGCPEKGIGGVNTVQRATPESHRLLRLRRRRLVTKVPEGGHRATMGRKVWCSTRTGFPYRAHMVQRSPTGHAC